MTPRSLRPSDLPYAGAQLRAALEQGRRPPRCYAIELPWCRVCLGPMPFDMRPDKIGWTVFEVDTGRPVSMGDLLLVELEHDDADALVDLLNRRVKTYEAGPGASS